MPNNINYDKLDTKSKRSSFLINSMIEELEAIDYYNQRASQLEKNDPLHELIIHNRDEEIEHFSMLVELFRNGNKIVDKKLKEYLFKKDDVTKIENSKK